MRLGKKSFILQSNPNVASNRSAKGKLPKEMKKKVEDWKFSSGALMVCLVAYSDGKEIQAFQSVDSLLLIGSISLCS